MSLPKSRLAGHLYRLGYRTEVYVECSFQLGVELYSVASGDIQVTDYMVAFDRRSSAIPFCDFQHSLEDFIFTHMHTVAPPRPRPTMCAKVPTPPMTAAVEPKPDYGDRRITVTVTDFPAPSALVF